MADVASLRAEIDRIYTEVMEALTQPDMTTKTLRKQGVRWHDQLHRIVNDKNDLAGQGVDTEALREPLITTIKLVFEKVFDLDPTPSA